MISTTEFKRPDTSIHYLKPLGQRVAGLASQLSSHNHRNPRLSRQVIDLNSRTNRFLIACAARGPSSSSLPCPSALPRAAVAMVSEGPLRGRDYLFRVSTLDEALCSVVQGGIEMRLFAASSREPRDSEGVDGFLTLREFRRVSAI